MIIEKYNISQVLIISPLSGVSVLSKDRYVLNINVRFCNSTTKLSFDHFIIDYKISNISSILKSPISNYLMVGFHTYSSPSSIKILPNQFKNTAFSRDFLVLFSKYYCIFSTTSTYNVIFNINQ